MNKAYETMRNFWLDVKNLQHKNEVPCLGPAQVCVAGVEMAAQDDKGIVKHIWIAASSLGNASLYFENNSPSGLGGLTGGSASGPVRDKALHLMQAAAKSAMQLSPSEQLIPVQQPGQVSLFVVDKEGHLRVSTLPEADVRSAEHPLYAMFAYSQQLLGAFRAQQEAAASVPNGPVPPAVAASK